MAKAFIKRSKRGNDLINLTLGPKEVASVLALLDRGPFNEHSNSVATALKNARFDSRNAKYAVVNVIPEVKSLVLV